MEKIFIELFCGINNKKNIYSDNKTLVCLYSIFMFFFVIVFALLNYYKTNKVVPLIISCPFLFLSLFFFVWLRKSKKRKSYKHYFLFQGVVTLSISLVWLFASFLNISSNELEFSIFYIFIAICGIMFVFAFFFLKFSKWQRYKTAKPKEYHKSFNVRIGSISIILLLACTTFIKKIKKIILYKLLTGGLFILFFAFLTIALNMFINYYIVNKFYQQYDEKNT